jgi:hypothetical protein
MKIENDYYSPLSAIEEDKGVFTGIISELDHYTEYKCLI